MNDSRIPARSYLSSTKKHDPYKPTYTLADERARKQVQKLVVDLLTSQVSLTRQDISKLRSAEQAAISVLRPSRLQLFNIYYDLVKDGHFIGCRSNRMLSVLLQKIKIVDKEGEQNDELTDLINKSWFRTFRKHVLETPYYGHTLIELGDLVKDEDGKPKFINTKIVPRGFVFPKFGTVVNKAFDEPKNGINYREAPYNNWYIEVGEEDDLGLLLPLGFQILPKKNMFTFWDQFGEIFGMPIRIGRTSSRDSKDLDAMENMLKNMGAAAYGIFPAGTEIEIKESSKFDAFNVYDKRIERADKEISKAVLGSTMTIDDGSSRSQGEVHERVTEKIIKADSEMELTIINDKLLPVLTVHGFGFKGYHAEYDDTYEFTPEEIAEVEKTLLDYYDVDSQYFIDKYGIPVQGIKQQTPADNQLSRITQSYTVPGKKKRTLADPAHNQIRLVTESLYSHLCPVCTALNAYTSITLAKEEDLLKEATRIAKLMHEGKWPDDQLIDPELTQLVATQLREAIIKGYGKDFDEIDTETPDFKMLQRLESDTYYFSAAKNYQQLKEMKSALLDGQGKLRPFSEFRQLVTDINKAYNVNYLKAEYNLAVNSSQQASRWAEYQANADTLPDIQYKTVGDSRVRDDHRALDGITRTMSDDFWNTYFPPNGWNCRCTTIQLRDGQASDISKGKLPVLDKVFRQNMAKDGLAFPSGHPYYSIPKDDLKAVKRDSKRLFNNE